MIYKQNENGKDFEMFKKDKEKIEESFHKKI